MKRHFKFTKPEAVAFLTSKDRQWEITLDEFL